MSEKAMNEVTTPNLPEYSAVEAWRQVQPRYSEPKSIEILKSKKKSAVFRLIGAGPGDTSIIAKRCVSPVALFERMVYEEILAGLQVSTPHWYGFLQETDGQYGWLFLEDGGGKYDRTCAEHRALAGRWLGALHVAGVKMKPEHRLPRLDPDRYLNLLHTSCEGLRMNFTNPILPEEDVQMLQALVADCGVLESHWEKVEKICQYMPRTIVHGDFVIRNICVRDTAEGPVLWAIDWEKAGYGVPVTDLAQYTGRTASPDLDAYSSVLREYLPHIDEMAVRELSECGKFFRLLDDISWEIPKFMCKPYKYLITPMLCLKSYQSRLHEALQTIEWTKSIRVAEHLVVKENGHIAVPEQDTCRNVKHEIQTNVAHV
jgi:thiamine kinase-like enzyme